MSDIKPTLRYPGSKWRLAEWITSMLPPHDVYVEPFFGSGAVFFTKEPSRVEIINDLSSNVVTFFRVLRERPAELERAIWLTPYSREEFDLSHCQDPTDDLELARQFFVRAWMSYAGKLGSRSGWRAVWDGSSSKSKRTAKISAVSLWQSLPERISPAACRLADALIECRPALAVIKQYASPQTVLFVDPPYLKTTLVAGSDRSNDKEWARYYEHSMTADEHAELLEVLDRFPGPVVLSGYRSELYDDRLAHWVRRDRTEISAVHTTRVESVWLSPVAAETLRQPELMSVSV